MSQITATAISLLSLLTSLQAEAPSNPLPSIKAPYAKVKPKLTADAKDPAWANAAQIASLKLHLGTPEDMKALPTEVFLLWDEGFFYVRFVCEDAELYMPFNGHDAPLYKGDVVEVFVDPKGDGRQYMEIEVNPANSVLDSMHLVTAEVKSNEVGMLADDIRGRDYWPWMEWTMQGAKTAARSIEENGNLKGWMADFALPASAVLHRLGLRNYQPMTMRFNFIRYEYALNLKSNGRQFIPMAWNPVQQGCPHISPAAMGRVELVKED
ncbi:MAG: carbohydrate-binding family 9-like protein [Planctomycetota bacterium]|nr:carbohydrate-binding family 9-like protein [Planctomycetota bacterium]